MNWELGLKVNDKAIINLQQYVGGSHAAFGGTKHTWSEAHFKAFAGI